ncbi:PLP-dependent aminotransferase family protein [Candidatus Peregrinibacteria bacterium]|nr:PLP-dependent aminotransferase family protein [Candidatus Peregrinibacteria bacterium]
MSYLLSKNSEGIIPGVMTNVLKWTVSSDIISFAGGMPDPKLFPLDEVTLAAQKVAKEDGHIVLQYAPAEGHKGLKDYFRQHFFTKEILTSVEGILPVCGVQQGLYLSCQLFLNSGDKILITSPSYFGALQTFDAFLVDYLTIALTEEGIDLKELERLFKEEKPKFFYVIPNFQNPTGITLPQWQRQRIAELALKYDVPILEDDVFGDLYFESSLKPIKAYAPQQVIYLTSLSKTVASGFRLGFVVPPRELLSKYVLAKQLNDVNLNTYVQYIVYELCKNGTFEKLLPILRTKYSERKDALLDALSENCSDLASWTRPTGGMFLWLYLNDKSIDASKLLEYAANRGLVFLPGSAFFPHGSGGKSELRFSFSNLGPEKIHQGVRLFSRYVRACPREFIDS